MASGAPSSLLDHVGPPASKWMTYISRSLQYSVFLVIAIWVFFVLGGVRFSPTPVPERSDTNDTSRLFNWHPILMTLAFVICMGEAIMAYKSPLMKYKDRKMTKYAHFGLHTAAGVIMTLGFIAVYKAHTLKKPVPMSDFYSVHSWIGLSTFFLYFCQWILGLLAFLFPRWNIATRSMFAPIHGFLGLSTFIFGIAAIALGLQEKATFIQLVSSPGVRNISMQLPVAAVVLLGFYAFFTLYHFVPSANSRSGTRVHDPIPVATDEIPLYSIGEPDGNPLTT